MARETVNPPAVPGTGDGGIRTPRSAATTEPPAPPRAAATAETPSPAAPEPEPTVFVVDDDQAMLRLIRKLLATRKVETYTSGAEFLAAYAPDRPGCLLLDVKMPGMSGLALQERLAADAITLPILIITGYGDVPIAVQAMRQGAFDFIEKPFSGQVLVERIEAALAEDARRRKTRITREEVRRRRATLTQRERQVMDLVVQGKPNKLVGSALGLSPKTVEVHRANVMKKMEAQSLADLVRMALLLGDEPRQASAP